MRRHPRASGPPRGRSLAPAVLVRSASPRHQREGARTRGRRILALALLLAPHDLAAADSASPPAAARKDLLVWRDAKGAVHTVTTAEDWRRRRESIARALESTMGALPEKWRGLPLDPGTQETVETPRYVRARVSFRAEPADRVTAWLLVPRERKGRLPAVLCLHQTTGVGKDEPAGLGGKAEMWYAAELAERGFVTLAPDYWTFGDYRTKTYDPYEQGYESGTMKGIWNHVRCVDYLQSLDAVDGDRIGCIGHSLGGHNGLWLGVFEPRIRAFVSSCGFSSLSSYAASPYGGGDLRNYAQRRYMPLFAKRFRNDPEKVPWDFPDVLGALAPRPVFVSAPLRDENFEASSVRECIEAALPVYRLLGAPGGLVTEYPEAGHTFPKDTRERAYDFLEKALR